MIFLRRLELKKKITYVDTKKQFKILQYKHIPECWKLCGGPYPECDEVCDGGDGDGDPGVLHGSAHPLFHRGGLGHVECSTKILQINWLR